MSRLATSDARYQGIQCSASSRTSSCDPGIAACSRSAWATGKCLSRPAQRISVGVVIVGYSSASRGKRPLVACAHLGDEGPHLGAPERAPEVGAQVGREAGRRGEETSARPAGRPAAGSRRRISRFQPNRRSTRISHDVASSHWTSEFMTDQGG